jgi:O-antigen ligase
LSAVQDKIRVWKGIFLTASLGSAAVIVGFFSRTIRYRQELAAGGDPAFYLRNGGLLHHWMIYATVEIVVFAALLEFRAAYPEARRWTQPALIVNSLAVVVSLTRSLWLACFVLVVAHLLWHRSRLVWLAPIVPLIALWAGPTSLRARVAVSFQPDYYSNAERVQMLRVGWKMIREQPLMGKGPGRVDKLYPSYLASGEPVPAYHGHLHNNAVQLAAQFGIPALAAAMLWLAVLVHELLRRCRIASAREEAFLARTAMMALGGFLLVGMTDYTYGHSLGLILVSFASLPPLTPRAD